MTTITTRYMGVPMTRQDGETDYVATIEEVPGIEEGWTERGSFDEVCEAIFRWRRDHAPPHVVVLIWQKYETMVSGKQRAEALFPGRDPSYIAEKAMKLGAGEYEWMDPATLKRYIENAFDAYAREVLNDVYRRA